MRSIFKTINQTLPLFKGECLKGEGDSQLSNNIGIDPKVVCHFSGKPSTTRLSKESIYFSNNIAVDPENPC